MKETAFVTQTGLPPPQGAELSGPDMPELDSVLKKETQLKLTEDKTDCVLYQSLIIVS